MYDGDGDGDGGGDVNGGSSNGNLGGQGMALENVLDKQLLEWCC